MTQRYASTAFQDRYAMYKLTEESTQSWFTIAPERGGIVTSLGLGGRELLYMDKTTLDDPAANVRGGIPVLFPISGQLTGGQYTWQDRTYTMKNHGVARTSAWTVEQVQADETKAAITVSLTGSEETLAAFPFPFELRFTYELQDGRLRIEQQYKNAGSEPMPMYPGFHPYFNADRKSFVVDSDAKRLIDYNDDAVRSFEGAIDLNGKPESLVLIDAKQPYIAFEAAGGRTVRLEYGPEFKYVVFWSVEGSPFVCVEPWMALTQELNRQQELVLVQPGETLSTFLTISAE